MLVNFMNVPNILNKIFLERVTFCYPYKIKQWVKPEHMGVLKPYYKIPLTKEQADNLIYLLLKSNPYVGGSMGLDITFYEHGTTPRRERCKGIYFNHHFINYCDQEQTIGDLNVKFNFTSEDEVNL